MWERRKNRLINEKRVAFAPNTRKVGRVSDIERQREGRRPFDVRFGLAPVRAPPLLFRCPHLKRG